MPKRTRWACVLVAVLGGLSASARLAADVFEEVALGDVPAVRLYLKRSGSPNLRDSSRTPLLHIAVRANQRAVVQILLDSQAAANAKDADGSTALHLAAALGRPYIAEMLLACGADATAKDKAGRTPLDLARANGQPVLVRQLETATAPAGAAHGGITGSDGGVVPGVLLSGVFLKAEKGDIEGVRAYLDQGGDVSKADERGATLLHHAVAADNGAMADLLLARGANANARNRGGLTPLLMAARAGGRAAMVRKLVVAFADPTVRDPAGHTAHDAAAAQGDVHAVARLMDAEVALLAPRADGAPAPDFTLNDLDGRPARLSEYRGKVVLVILWDYDPRFESTVFGAVEAAQMLARSGPVSDGRLAVLACTPAPPDVARRLRDRSKYAFRVLPDPGGVVRARFAANGPSAMVIDRQGRLVWSRRLADIWSVNLAVQQALAEPRKAPAPTTGAPGEPGSVVFADFESGYRGWTLKGDCWSAEPATNAMYPGRAKGYVGRSFVCTMGTKDFKATGLAISAPFTITRPYVHFLVGGVDAIDHGSLSLVVDGCAVRSATGRDSDELDPVCWDVRDLMGKTGHFEILDAGAGASIDEFRDYVLVDQIVLSDSPSLPDSFTGRFDPDDPQMAKAAYALEPPYYRELRAGRVHTEVIPGPLVHVERKVTLVWPRGAKDLTCVLPVPPSFISQTVQSAKLLLGTPDGDREAAIIETDNPVISQAFYARVPPNDAQERRVPGTLVCDVVLNALQIAAGPPSQPVAELSPEGRRNYTRPFGNAGGPEFHQWLQAHKLIRWPDEGDMAYTLRAVGWCQRNCRYTLGQWGSRPPLRPGQFGLVDTQTGDCAGLSGILVSILRANGVPSTLIGGPGHWWSLVFISGAGWFRVDNPNAANGYGKGPLDLGMKDGPYPFIENASDYPRAYQFPDGPSTGRIFCQIGDQEYKITEVKR